MSPGIFKTFVTAGRASCLDHVRFVEDFEAIAMTELGRKQNGAFAKKSLVAQAFNTSGAGQPIERRRKFNPSAMNDATSALSLP